MKFIFALSLSAIAIAARADVVLQEKIESTEQNGTLTLKIKGDKTRLDIPTVRLGDVSIIQNLDTGDKIILVHQQKVAKMQSASEQAGNNDDGKRPALMKTGRAEKIGDYNAEIYTWTNSAGMSGTFWVATNYPGYLKFRQALKKARESEVRQMPKDTRPPDTGALPGMIVKSKRTTPSGDVTMTLISAKEEPVADSDFQIPSDYHAPGLNFGK